MADGGNTVPSVTKAEHIGPVDTGDNIEAKRVALYVWDGVSSWTRYVPSAGGGGTQYADGTARGTATGTLSMVDDGINIQSLKGDTGGRAIIGSETFTIGTTTASSSGNNTVYTPASGKKVRLYSFGYSAGANVTGCLAGLRFGPAGTIFNNQYLITAGQAWNRNFQGGKRYIEGAVDESLIVNLGAAQTVYINYEAEDVT